MAFDSSHGQNFETAVFANGCFWCTEAVFASLKGVTSVVPGYAIGKGVDAPSAPTYENVSTGETGYAEAIKIGYDPAVVSYEDLLIVYFNTHDPKTRNQQGADVGTQYRSAIFYVDAVQEAAAEKLIAELDTARAYDKPIVTEVQQLGAFHEAENYHKEYYKHHSDEPYCQIVIAPKLEVLQQRFKALLKRK